MLLSVCVGSDVGTHRAVRSRLRAIARISVLIVSFQCVTPCVELRAAPRAGLCDRVPCPSWADASFAIALIRSLLTVCPLCNVQASAALKAALDGVAADPGVFSYRAAPLQRYVISFPFEIVRVVTSSSQCLQLPVLDAALLETSLG